MHTSTITVAVLTEPTTVELEIDPRDLEESFTRGTGKGGQHRNKSDTAVVLVHKPTGVRARVDGGRSQHRNRLTALAIVRARLWSANAATSTQGRNELRRAQIGSGMRGDKVRTVRVRHDEVVDHRTGRNISYRQYQRGQLAGLRC